MNSDSQLKSSTVSRTPKSGDPEVAQAIPYKIPNFNEEKKEEREPRFYHFFSKRQRGRPEKGKKTKVVQKNTGRRGGKN